MTATPINARRDNEPVSAPSGTQFGECRSCKARIIWAKANGKPIPLSTATHPKPNIRLNADGTASYVAPGLGTHISHFADCPNSKQHRKPKE